MKRIFLVCCGLITGFISQAQQSVELGGNIGFTGYLGDLQSPDFTYRSPGFVMGLSARQNLNPFFAARGFFNVGRISADDKDSPDLSHRLRNLNFRSNVIELGLQLEYNILPFDNFNPYATHRHLFNFTPYLFGGVNVFRFNPKAYYFGDWVALQPLKTEGQTTYRAYSRTQIAIPFGLGFKWQIDPQITASFEFGFRKTFTDYLDDVSTRYAGLDELTKTQGKLSAELSFRGDELNSSQSVFEENGVRGDPDDKDWYMMNTFTIAYKLYRER